jgi:hypothetical protein
MKMSSTIIFISLPLNIIIGYVLAIVLTGKVVGARSRGIYTRRNNDFYRIHHYQLGLYIILEHFCLYHL